MSASQLWQKIFFAIAFDLRKFCTTFALAMEYIVSIDKEKINEMPVAEYGSGNIYVVEAMSQVNAAVAHLRKFPLIGFDTETRPSFKRGEHHKLALIQLATPSDCFLFRINKLKSIPLKLKEYMEDPGCAKVGLSTPDDINQMQRVTRMRPAGFIEIQKMVKEFSITDLSLQKIYAILFGQKISKGQRLTNWEADELTPSQQRYAAIDAWACIDIYNLLKSGEFIPEQSPYYHLKEDEQ